MYDLERAANQVQQALSIRTHTVGELPLVGHHIDVNVILGEYACLYGTSVMFIGKGDCAIN